MARRNRVFSSEFPYHISARCHNREWFKLEMETVWSIFEDYLYSSHHFYGLRIHSFVLMSNHFHLLATTPRTNIDQCMRHLMTETSREITRLSGRINQTFGGPYFSSLIKSPHYFSHAYKYVYRNPIEAGLCRSVESYRYSTLSGLLGRRQVGIPLQEDAFLFDEPSRTLDWLNEKPTKENWVSLQKALRRPTFELPLNRASRKPHPLEEASF